MKSDEFVGKLCHFASTNLAPRLTDPLTIVTVVGMSCGAGRTAVARKLDPILSLCTDENGDLDLEGIETSVTTGLDAAKSLPVLGGLLSIDSGDAREFFASLKTPSAVQQQ